MQILEESNGNNFFLLRAFVHQLQKIKEKNDQKDEENMSRPFK
jgi:hypothetical protein